ncbi:MAG: imidazole glycerol phosphate synthase subunit HisH [Candidatus Symbiobacter sp.]|nr:imidazole glycerol phosphate synthase subunit HisH [Candidatus Symbiobacter sp.]
MTVVILDCGSGNLFSVAKALAATLPGDKKESDIVITDQAAILAKAEKIILPGQGAFARCRQGLVSRPGVLAMLAQKTLVEKTPFLGICVGMQLMVERGVEHGDHPGLGWIFGSCEAIKPEKSLKIPHMGWNDIELTESGKTHPLLRGIKDGDHAYFVHSYAVTGCPRENLLATTDYGSDITAIIGRDNIFGTQFHVEKSQQLGLQILRNFWQWDGSLGIK